VFSSINNEVKRIFYLSINYPELKKRNELIASGYQRLRDLLYDVGLKNVNPVKYAETVWRTFITTYAMESITFYMGFLIIHLYQYKYGLLPMTNKMISEIKADELFHVKVMSYIINKIRPWIEKYLSPDTLDEIAKNIIDSFVNADILFYQSVIQNNEFNISDKQVELYIKNLANRRYKLISKDVLLYPGFEMNPFEDIDKLYGYVESHINEGKKESIFETKSAAYQNQSIEDSLFDNFEL
jgi:ribonucleotide reductase beta subunit family protein with ferritin-like domain